MSLEADTIVHSRRLRRRLIFWRTLAVVAIVGVVVAALQFYARDDLGAFGTGGYVARISVSGVIVEDRDLLERIDDFASDDRAKALLVAIDSPGGTVVGGEALYDTRSEEHTTEPQPLKR